jgi:hypothetical protein
MDPPLTLNLITAAIAAAIAPLEQRINARFDAMDVRFDAIEHRLDAMDVLQRRQAAFQLNSTKCRTEMLEVVPNLDGQNPNVDYPETLNHLLVAGSERIPLGDLNTWNKHKSKALLDFYGAVDAYDSDSEADNTPTARILRLKLAKVLGISSVQIQNAYSSFGDI